jgi:hypothetical protein
MLHCTFTQSIISGERQPKPPFFQLKPEPQIGSSDQMRHESSRSDSSEPLLLASVALDCIHPCKWLISLFSIIIDNENSAERYFRP